MNFLRILIVITSVTMGMLSYTVLVFGTSSRAVQTLGLPLLGLITAAIARWLWATTDWDCAKRPLMAFAPLIGLWASIGVAGCQLVRLARREAPAHVIQSDPDLQDKIRSLIEQRSWAGVVRLGGEVGSIRDPQVLLDIGYAHQQLDDLSQAEAYCRQAIKIDPANPAARYELARVYEKTNDLESAAAQYQAALNIDDSLADVHLAYGALLVRLGEFGGHTL